MPIFVSIVSHAHSKTIADLATVERLNLVQGITVVIKNNIQDPFFFECLKDFDHHLIDDKSLYGMGFGENNNYIFNYCIENLGMSEEDYFCVLNPDIDISSNVLCDLVEIMEKDYCLLSTINLYLDENQSCYDKSIREFPSLISFVGSFLSVCDLSIDKSEILYPIEIDWAAGSFLMFKASHYKSLNGFDEGYFMYCEDIDICFRSFNKGVKVKYYPSLSAIHLAGFANRKLFSRHFIWHVKSAFRFVASKYSLVKRFSSVD